MKEMKKAAILCLCLVLALTLFACGKKRFPTELTDHVWEGNGETYRFNQDGTGLYSFDSTEIPFTYSIMEDKILSIEYEGADVPANVGFSFADGKLLIKGIDGEDLTYTAK